MLTLENYELEEKLFENDDSLVYRATRRVDSLPVTVKLPRSTNPGARATAALRHEYKLLRELDLPGVIGVYGLERIGSGLALIEESVAGESLAALLRRRRLTLLQSLKITLALARALDGLHGRGIVHKDIKPHNAIVNLETLAVHLIDFGIAARLTRVGAWQGRPERVEGTLAYMSPEQTGRTSRGVDARSDLYSLGVTFYQMLTGALPFVSDDALALVHAHVAREPTPPHDRAPDVPRAVSAIVLKLMAKSPDERYQSARGLALDLEEAIEQLEETGVVLDFALGGRDFSPELRISRRVFGREREREALAAAFARARAGRPELATIAGYSGVGKSALVATLQEGVASSGGWFVSGKYDAHDRGTPYAGIADALRMLMGHLLTERDASLARWRERLQSAVGSVGGLLFQLVPELEVVIGEQPPVEPLPPSAAQNRFRLVFQALLQALASRERPLLMFLDDLQWVDAASVKLLEHVLTSSEECALLVIAAYRDNEVDEGHTMQRAVDKLEQAGACQVRLSLEPLGEDSVRAWLADTLRRDVDDVAELATLVFAKTRGNPFFLTQFVQDLHERELLAFDADAGAWAWDADAIARAQVTDNVADLLLSSLGELPPATLEMLMRAACLEHEFNLSTLAAISACGPGEVVARVEPAIVRGLLVPLDDGHRLWLASAGSGEADALSDAVEASYRFLHDRVQEAAYSLIVAEDREDWHLRIGRHLRARLDAAGGSTRDAALYECVGHLNRGLARIDDERERLLLARMNLEAGRRAKRDTAYASASQMLSCGVRALGDDPWAVDRALCFALHHELCECEYMDGHTERSDSIARATLERAESRLERIKLQTVRMSAHLIQGRFLEGFEIGREGMALFGHELSTDDAALNQAVGVLMGETHRLLAGRAPEDIEVGEPVIDEELIAYQVFLSILDGIAFVAKKAAIGVTSLTVFNLTLSSPHTPMSPLAYNKYGMLLAFGMQRYAEGYAFSKLGLDLAERTPSAALLGPLLMNVACQSMFCRPLAEAIDLCERALTTSLQAGDLVFAGYSALLIGNFSFSHGLPLAEQSRECVRIMATLRRLRDPLSIGLFAFTRQGVRALQGKTAEPLSLSDDEFDEQAALAGAIHKSWAEPRYYSIKLMLAYVHRDLEAARRFSVHALEQLVFALANFYQIDILQFVCLTALTSAIGEGPEALAEALESIAAHVQALEDMRACSGHNFAHKLDMIYGERARAEGRADEAIARFDAAIEGARRAGFLHDEALACELAAHLALARGWTRIAAAYMSDAHDAYTRWGATAKVEALTRQHGELIQTRREVHGETNTSTSSTRTVHGSSLDVTSVLLASQTIAGEIELDKVLERIMRIVLTTAGAQRCLLLLKRDDRLLLDAMMEVSPDVVRVGMAAPLEERDDLARSVVQFVARSRETVVLGDDSEDPRFGQDPYLARQTPRSLMCFALTHQTRLVGVLYLENKVVERAFTHERIELLRLLSTQAAIAVENATLYGDVRRATAQLRETNERLEQLVGKRTVELQQANEALRQELEARVQREHDRETLQARIISMQEERLRELSTPLIPITNRIVVMPLIGAMDKERARHVMEAALQGAQHRAARVVIIDVTGMTSMDTATADTIVRCARALGLLGAEAVLTGIQPEVARILVELEIDFKIATHHSLQSGIAYALAKTGEYGALTGR